jgi:ankyrin repeat protein
MLALLRNHENNNNRALYLAVKEGNATVVQILLARGADPDAQVGPNGETARDLARRINSPAIPASLRNHEDNNRSLYEAIKNGNMVAARTLTALGADPNVPVGPNGETTMALAHRINSPAIPASSRNHERINNRALYLAVKDGNVLATRQLLALHADPNAPVGPNGETARDLARRIGNPAILALFAPPK